MGMYIELDMESDMENLIKSIIQNHPEFADEIEGVSDDEIQRLAHLVPFSPLPVQYVIFLKYMGKNTGRITVTKKGKLFHSRDKFTISNTKIPIDFHAIYKHYKDYQKYKDQSHSKILGTPDLFLFGINTIDDYKGDYYLDLQQKDLPVIQLDEDDSIIEISTSLMEFIFAEDFRRDVAKFMNERKWMK